MEALRRGHERAPLVGEPAEQIGDQCGLGRIGADAGGVARAVGIGPVPVRRASPGQHLSGLQLVQPAAAGPLRDERALVLGHGPADLQEQLILRIVGQRPVGELDLTAVALQLLHQQHLVDVVAGQPLGVGNQDAVELGQRGEVAELVEAGSPERRAGVTVVAEDVLVGQLPQPVPGDALEPLKLLIDRLGLGLALRRDSNVDRDSHPHTPG